MNENTIMLEGSEHKVDALLTGFEIIETHSSSNVKILGLCPAQGRIYIMFRNGSQYVYDGVPEKLMNDCKAAESVGSFISRKIAHGFDTKKVNGVIFTKVRNVDNTPLPPQFNTFNK